jgi:excisionase family DNA binding protein
MDEILTIPQVAKYLQISKAKIYYLVQRKQIPHIKIGRNVRIKASDLETWITNQVINIGDGYTPGWRK